MLTERQYEVLMAIVFEYIHTGEPVGSRSLSKKYLTRVSAATIRNEMADLEEMGYITQPHTSAGRIPTSRAFRVYVDSILEGKRERSPELADRLLDLKRQGLTILLTTHAMEEAERFCDRLCVVDHGRVTAEGTPRGLISRRGRLSPSEA